MFCTFSPSALAFEKHDIIAQGFLWAHSQDVYNVLPSSFVKSPWPVWFCIFQAFTLKFVEIGKILFTTNVLKSTPPHKVHIFQEYFF